LYNSTPQPAPAASTAHRDRISETCVEEWGDSGRLWFSFFLFSRAKREGILPTKRDLLSTSFFICEFSSNLSTTIAHTVGDTYIEVPASRDRAREGVTLQLLKKPLLFSHLFFCFILGGEFIARGPFFGRVGMKACVSDELGIEELGIGSKDRSDGGGIYK
jgi:hypothetical protein